MTRLNKIISRPLPRTVAMESRDDLIFQHTKDTVIPLARVLAGQIVADCLTTNGINVNVLAMQDAIATELTVVLGNIAIVNNPQPLYRALAGLLNIRQLPTAQAWFVDAGCRLDYHNLTDAGSPICNSCGLRPIAGSGLLLCVFCASRT